jgi:hypothetical protein
MLAKYFILGLVALGLLMFFGGGFCGVWWCSQKQWCPIYMKRVLRVWLKKVALENLARREGHPEFVQDFINTEPIDAEDPKNKV